MKPSRRPIVSTLRWVLAAGFAAAAIYTGGACGNDACENAATHAQNCLMQRQDAGADLESSTSTVDCSGATECDAVCVLDSDCEVITTFYSVNVRPDNPLAVCLRKCEKGTTR